MWTGRKGTFRPSAQSADSTSGFQNLVEARERLFLAFFLYKDGFGGWFWFWLICPQARRSYYLFLTTCS